LDSVMCWKCEQIDKEIGHYRSLSARVTDERSVKSLDILIAKLEAEKNEVHIAELDTIPKATPPR
jgi:hypothetical protein